MPIPSEIAGAAGTFNQNARLLSKCFEGLTPEEWLRSPSESSNSILWITGHVIWARSVAVRLLGSAWERPWLAQFERGHKHVDGEQYPPAEVLVLGWQEASAALAQALEGATAEVLAAPAPPKAPSPDGKVKGMIDFLAFHETYHLGQVAYLRTWLGHNGVAG